MAIDLYGAIALVAGGASGIGAAAPAAGRPRCPVAVADVDERDAGVAAAIGGRFAAATLREQADNEAAVAAVVAAFGGLDVAFLNAGGSTHEVFFGVNAALPALRARGRGALVFTSSLAGLTAVPGDPVYAATKHAVIGLARALGPALAADDIAVNTLCPGFADTAINEAVRHLISAARIPLMTADEVADALLAVLASDRTGEAWYVQPGRPAEPFAFRNVPGPRAPDGSRIGGVPGMP